MKKFASIFISVLLVALMVFPTVAFAAIVDDIDQDTGSVTVMKYEPDSNKTEAVEGATFAIYNVLKLDLESGLFSIAEDFEGVGLEDLIEDDADDGLTHNSTEAFEALIPDLQEVAEESATAVDTQTTDGDGAATFDNLPLGVYLVVETGVPAVKDGKGYVASTRAFLVSVPQWDQDYNNGAGRWVYEITAYPKDDPIKVTKSIVEDGEKVNETTSEIGDTITFEIKADIPNYYDGAHVRDGEGENDKFTLTTEEIERIEFKFTDTMSAGLTFDGTTFKAAVRKTDGTDEEVFDAGTDYEITVVIAESGVTTITVDFINWAALKPYQGKDIYLTYNAVLNENAVIGEANTNKVQLDYTNDPRSNADPVKKSTIITKENKVYTYGLELNKTLNGSTPVAADGVSAVEFSMKKDRSGDKLFFIYDPTDEENPSTYTLYKPAMSQTFTYNEETDEFEADPEDAIVAVEGEKVIIGGVEYTFTTQLHPTETGVLNVRGLDGDTDEPVTYYLTEDKSLDGYSKLSSDITITVKALTDDDGLTGEAEITMTGYTNSATGNTITSNSGVFSITVNNVWKQFDLPLTGGAGLLAFTIGGGIVIAGAIILFSLLRKKRSAK